ncbi:hypothetical protein NSE_0358 [Neorickettsia sennetsu str. Miyayama]|uniref:Uncharacterized protein n=1 Tax=Ehrlichia sennetsu (strain ATCC VR-367 / Miyayama) TaxID=222891 RepID=Q2GE49_EHRS3|nr:hypothetical protein NSE_0358 [Neorickettsia sennetsu str. Miyayama]
MPCFSVLLDADSLCGVLRGGIRYSSLLSLHASYLIHDPV